MKYKLFLLLLFFIVLSGCSVEETLENQQQRDGDDLNVIQDVWPQAFDQMLNFDPRTIVWSQISEQKLPIDKTKNLLYKPSNDTETIINSEVVNVQPLDTTIQQNDVLPVVKETNVSQNTYKEDEKYWEKGEYEWEVEND